MNLLEKLRTRRASKIKLEVSSKNKKQKFYKDPSKQGVIKSHNTTESTAESNFIVKTRYSRRMLKKVYRETGKCKKEEKEPAKTEEAEEF